MDKEKEEIIDQLISHYKKIPEDLYLESKIYLEGYTHTEVRYLRSKYDIQIKNFKKKSIAILFVSDKIKFIFNIKHI